MITIREKTIDEKIAEIEDKYNAKFQATEKRLIAVILSDGIGQNGKTIDAQNEYRILADQKESEIMEVLGGLE